MSTTDRNHMGSPDRFGYAWERYEGVIPETRGQLERWLGSTGLLSFKNKRVLDVGCGMGRNPYWYLEAGAAHVTAIDFDDRSLAAARNNLERFPNARVDKLSVYDLDPAVHGRFDRVTCIGVLHHLAEPERALAAMWKCVAPGGDLVLWCYAKPGNRLMIPIIQTLRFIGSRAPLSLTHRAAQGIAAATWPVFRTFPFRTDYYRSLKNLSYKNYQAIVLDQILPRISHYWTQKDMERLTSALPEGRAVIEFVQGNSWHARVEKPAVT